VIFNDINRNKVWHSELEVWRPLVVCIFIRRLCLEISNVSVSYLGFLGTQVNGSLPFSQHILFTEIV
jgi:hypothetical protein